ncbi:MAG: hypothetical protein Q9190_004924 [Brigantiaea leucoxantha]
MPIIQVTQNDNRQLQNIADILASSKKDFRSEAGLYNLIQSSYDKAVLSRASPRHKQTSSPTRCRHANPHAPSNVKGKDLFDSQLWKDPTSTSVFYKFIASLRQRIRDEVRNTTPTHRFIRTVRDSRKLVRCYTQNIDGLELREGLSMDLTSGSGTRKRFTKKATESLQNAASRSFDGDLDGGCEVVPLHGDLQVLRCTLCLQTCTWEETGREGLLLKGKAPNCHSCAMSDQQRRDRGKRGTKIGTLRPNVVLYGEEHPLADTVGKLVEHDLTLAPDVLLILGTSLHVHGVRTMVKEFAKCVHARSGGKGKVVFINLSQPSQSVWKDTIDYWVSMDCDEWVSALRRHRPDFWQVQTKLDLKVKKKDTQRPNIIATKTYLFPDKENRDSGSTKGVPSANIRHSSSTVRSKQVLSEARSESSRPTASSQDQTNHRQLPTPPHSGHRQRTHHIVRKRTQGSEDETEIQTPSKRRKVQLDVLDKQQKPLSQKVASALPSKLKRVKPTIGPDFHDEEAVYSSQTTDSTSTVREKTSFHIYED